MYFDKLFLRNIKNKLKINYKLSTLSFLRPNLIKNPM